MRTPHCTGLEWKALSSTQLARWDRKSRSQNVKKRAAVGASPTL